MAISRKRTHEVCCKKYVFLEKMEVGHFLQGQGQYVSQSWHVETVFPLAAEVFIPMPGGRAKVDVTKRGGRYESDFIWNTPWKEQVFMTGFLDIIM